jgi:hypothetical protein
MKEAGYKLVKDLDFLPEQSFMIFSLADKAPKSANTDASVVV